MIDPELNQKFTYRNLRDECHFIIKKWVIVHCEMIYIYFGDKMNINPKI